MPVLELSRADAPAVRARALVFEDPRSRELLTRLEQVAPTEATVLITGETGTGKELVARYLHERSARAAAPFVAVNCGALTPSLLESELFGHEKAAFTGALSAKAGVVRGCRRRARSSSTRSATCRCRRRSSSSACCRSARWCASGRGAPSPSTCASSRPPTPAWSRPSARVAFAKTSSIASTSRTSTSRRSAIAPATSCRWLATSSTVYLAKAWRFRRRTSTAEAEAKLLAHRWSGNIRELENAVQHALLVACDGSIDAVDLQLIVDAPTRALAEGSPHRPTSAPPPAPSSAPA